MPSENDVWAAGRQMETRRTTMATTQLSAQDTSDAPGKRRRTKLLMGVVLVIAVLGAGYWFLLTEPPENPWLAR